MTNLTKAIAVLGVVAGLGVAALPLSSYAIDPASKDVAVTLKIEDELTIEADKSTTDKVDLSAGDHTGDVTLTVVSNNQKGYNLTIKGSATNGTATSLTSENGDEIVKASGSFAIPAALSTTTSEWGYRIAALTDKFTDGLYAGVETTDVEIKRTDVPTGSTGDETVVTFGASIKDGQPAGTYDGQVTFTATNNANS